MMFLGSMFHLKFADLPLEVPQLVEEADSSADRHLHVQKQVKVDVKVEEEEKSKLGTKLTYGYNTCSCLTSSWRPTATPVAI